MPTKNSCRTILLIDDETEFVEALAERLRLRGFVVYTAGTGPAGLRQVLCQPLDVVILDLRLPGMDGMDVLRNIKKINAYLPVIMLTGHGDSRAEVLSTRLAVYSYHTKPMNIDDLIEKIHAACRARQSQARLAVRLATANTDEDTRRILEEEQRMLYESAERGDDIMTRHQS